MRNLEVDHYRKHLLAELILQEARVLQLNQRLLSSYLWLRFITHPPIGCQDASDLTFKKSSRSAVLNLFGKRSAAAG